MQAMGVPATALGKRITGGKNNRLILQLVTGENIYAVNAELATDYFISNWPRSAVWPKDVPQPSGAREMFRPLVHPRGDGREGEWREERGRRAKDALRYRWVRDELSPEDFAAIPTEELDDFIDAQMAEKIEGVENDRD